jgi:hypothetical protein
MARYGKTAGKKVERAMHERKMGTLKSGRSAESLGEGSAEEEVSPGYCRLL